MSSRITSVYSAPRLPSELSDVIIDYLRTDKKALRACSLVCKEWLPRARYNTFQTVALHARNCVGFLQLLERTPDIVICVKDVTLRAPPPRPKTAPPSKMHEKTLVTVVSRLSSAEIFRFSDIEIDPAFASVFRHCHPRLHTLHLTLARLKCISHLFALLAALPALRTLRCHNVRFSSWTWVPASREALDMKGPPAASLTALECTGRLFCDPVQGQLLRWLVENGLHTKLRALGMPDIGGDDDSASLTALLRDAGPGLRVLSLGFAPHIHCGSDRASSSLGASSPAAVRCAGPCTVGGPASLAAALARCTGVRMLALHPIGLLRPAPWVLALLRGGVPTRALEHVCLRLHADAAREDDVGNIDWQGLVDTLPDTRRFPALRRLTVVVAGGQGLLPTILTHAAPLHAGLTKNGVHMSFVLR